MTVKKIENSAISVGVDDSGCIAFLSKGRESKNILLGDSGNWVVILTRGEERLEIDGAKQASCVSKVAKKDLQVTSEYLYDEKIGEIPIRITMYFTLAGGEFHIFCKIENDSASWTLESLKMPVLKGLNGWGKEFEESYPKGKVFPSELFLDPYVLIPKNDKTSSLYIASDDSTLAPGYFIFENDSLCLEKRPFVGAEEVWVSSAVMVAFVDDELQAKERFDDWAKGLCLPDLPKIEKANALFAFYDKCPLSDEVIDGIYDKLDALSEGDVLEITLPQNPSEICSNKEHEHIENTSHIVAWRMLIREVALYARENNKGLVASNMPVFMYSSLEGIL